MNPPAICHVTKSDGLNGREEESLDENIQRMCSFSNAPSLLAV